MSAPFTHRMKRALAIEVPPCMQEFFRNNLANSLEI